MDEFIEQYFTGDFALMNGEEFNNKTLSTLFFHFARSKVYGDLKGENKRLREKESELQATVEEMNEDFEQMLARHQFLQNTNLELNQTLKTSTPKFLDYVVKLKQLWTDMFGK